MITLSKIAKLANVSVSTASKAFAGSGEVSEETREMIFNIAKEHGCFKKFYNAKYPKLVIAIIAPEFSSSYYTDFLFHIQKNLENMNCELCVSATNFSENCEKSLLEYYYKHSNVDGIIIINAKSEINHEGFETPVVLINPANSNVKGICVSSKSTPALRECIDYLKGKQVDKIGFIGESLTQKKHETFMNILMEKGIDYNPEYVCIVNERFEKGGYEAMQSILSRMSYPRAIVCAYDYMAIGAMRCAIENGLRVPEDIAFVGDDDIRENAFLNPPLSSISNCIPELCQLAVSSVIKQINQQDAPLTQTITSKFVLRKSLEIN